MTRIHEYNESSVVVGIVPQDCAACGGRVDRVRLALDVVTSSGGDFIGIQSVATTPCCGGRRSAPYPVEHLARVLDHLGSCAHH